MNRSIELYKEVLFKKLNLNEKFLDEIFKKILERNYFDSNKIKKTKNLKKIQHIAKLVKEKNYPKIEELAEKIFGKEFIDNLKLEDMYKKRKKQDDNIYYHYGIKLVETFRATIPNIERLSFTNKVKSGGMLAQEVPPQEVPPQEVPRQDSDKTKKSKKSKKSRQPKSVSHKKKSKLSISRQHLSDHDNKLEKMLGRCRNKNEDCGICFETIQNDGLLLFKCRRCEKCLHLKCMVEYYHKATNNKIQCPYCRGVIPKKDLLLHEDLSTEPQEYVDRRANMSMPLPLVAFEVVLIGVFTLPIYGVTGGLIDPITSSVIIHSVISAGLSSSAIHTMFNSNMN